MYYATLGALNILLVDITGKGFLCWGHHGGRNPDMLSRSRELVRTLFSLNLQTQRWLPEQSPGLSKGEPETPSCPSTMAQVCSTHWAKEHKAEEGRFEGPFEGPLLHVSKTAPHCWGLLQSLLKPPKFLYPFLLLGSSCLSYSWSRAPLPGSRGSAVSGLGEPFISHRELWRIRARKQDPLHWQITAWCSELS